MSHGRFHFALWYPSVFFRGQPRQAIAQFILVVLTSHLWELVHYWKCYSKVASLWGDNWADRLVSHAAPSFGWATRNRCGGKLAGAQRCHQKAFDHGQGTLLDTWSAI